MEKILLISLTDIYDFDQIFEDIADQLLNHSILYINNNQFRITEVEFYLCCDQHFDIYTHKHPDQKTPIKFYFHKQGKTHTYKGGTYKGLDITFGINETNNEQSQDVYGGILIRAIENINNNDETIGPCNVVNKILTLSEHDNISDIVKKIPNLSCVDDKSVLYIEHFEQPNANLPYREIYKSPRFGLTYKHDPSYVVKNYRFLTNIKTNDKHRGASIINILKQYGGLDNNNPKLGQIIKNISNTTSVKPSQIVKYISIYKNPADFDSIIKSKPSNVAIIQLMAHLDQLDKDPINNTNNMQQK